MAIIITSDSARVMPNPPVIINNSVRCINSNFLLSEDQALAILEFVAHMCYKSDEHASDNTDEFLSSLYNKGHFNIFEHVSYNFLITYEMKDILVDILSRMQRVDHFIINKMYAAYDNPNWLITCNLRSLIELLWYGRYIQDIITNTSVTDELLLIASIFESLRLTWPRTYDIITDNGVFAINVKGIRSTIPILHVEEVPITIRNSLTRYVFHVICTHTVANRIMKYKTLSFSQEGTEFINYTSDDEACIFISKANSDNIQYQNALANAADYAINRYKNLVIDHKTKPEDAHDVFPLGSKTELVVSGTYKPYTPKFLYDGFTEFFQCSAQPSVTEISSGMASLIYKAQRENGIRV